MRALGKSPLGGLEIKGRKSAPKADQVGGEQGVVGKSVADPSQPFEIKAPASHRSVHRRQSSGGRRDDRQVGGLIGTKAIPFEAPVGAACSIFNRLWPTSNNSRRPMKLPTTRLYRR